GFCLPRWRLDVVRLTHLLLMRVPSLLATNRTVDQCSSMSPAGCQEFCAQSPIAVSCRMAAGRAASKAGRSAHARSARPRLLKRGTAEPALLCRAGCASNKCLTRCLVYYIRGAARCIAETCLTSLRGRSPVYAC